MDAPARNHQVPENFQTTELPGTSPRHKQYSPRTGRIITEVHIHIWSPDFIVHNNFKTRDDQASLIDLVNSVGYT